MRARVRRAGRWLPVLLVALAQLGCPGRPDEPAAGPGFELQALDGGTVRSADYEGRVLLLEFWATWCVPCRAQARILTELYPEFAARSVEFLAIDVAEDEALVRSFVEREPFPYPVLLDPAEELSGELGVFALPTIVVLDRRGEVVYQQPGISSEAVLRRVLSAAVEG